jgi:hypothetical protein
LARKHRPFWHTDNFNENKNSERLKRQKISLGKGGWRLFLFLGLDTMLKVTIKVQRLFKIERKINK